MNMLSTEKCPGCEYGHLIRIHRAKDSLDIFPSYITSKTNSRKRGIPVKEKYLYQYRSRDTFWDIINSNSFWVTSARFMNDFEELQHGMNVYLRVRDDMTKKKSVKDVAASERLKFLNGLKGTDLLGDCYVTCFSACGDKLSQWRGYAPNGGVSIGMDFSNVRPFSIEKIAPVDKHEDKFKVVYNVCCGVTYLDVDDLSKQFHSMVRDDLLSIFDHKSETAIERVPFLKHWGFSEESEFRLVFYNYSDNNLYGCVKYRSDSKGKKIPYIVVRAGDHNDTPKKTLTVRLAHSEIDNNLMQNIRKELSPDILLINCLDTHSKLDEECFGCTIRQWIPNELFGKQNIQCHWADRKQEQLILNHMSQAIYISQGDNQKRTCEIVRDIVRKNTRSKRISEIPVWCDGYLPIREILVGPAHDQREFLESLRHFCENTFWLQDVKIKASAIPFRD